VTEPAGSRGLVFAAVAPHGYMCIAEAAAPAERGLALSTRAALVEHGRRLAAAAPDVVVILTPHGAHVEGSFAVVTAGGASGELQGTPVSLTVSLDRALAAAIIRTMRESRLPVLGVSFGGNDPSEAVMPMDWGTLIPLWYLGGRADPPPRVVIVSPARDLTPVQHVEAGAALARAVAGSGAQVALVASADHGHAHLGSGPYGSHPAAAEYDHQISDLLREGNLTPLADLSPTLVANAKADSWWQLLMLHGAIGTGWRAELLAYERPTYFGMACAVFEPASQDPG